MYVFKHLKLLIVLSKYIVKSILSLLVCVWEGHWKYFYIHLKLVHFLPLQSPSLWGGRWRAVSQAITHQRPEPGEKYIERKNMWGKNVQCVQEDEMSAHPYLTRGRRWRENSLKYGLVNKNTVPHINFYKLNMKSKI